MGQAGFRFAAIGGSSNGDAKFGRAADYSATGIKKQA